MTAAVRAEVEPEDYMSVELLTEHEDGEEDALRRFDACFILDRQRKSSMTYDGVRGSDLGRDQACQ